MSETNVVKFEVIVNAKSQLTDDEILEIRAMIGYRINGYSTPSLEYLGGCEIEIKYVRPNNSES